VVALAAFMGVSTRGRAETVSGQPGAAGLRRVRALRSRRIGQRLADHRGAPDARRWRSAGGLLTSACGSAPPIFPATRLSAVLLNDAQGSELGVVVDGHDGTNTGGPFEAANRGTLQIEAPPP
jgi:hypothetical protein